MQSSKYQFRDEAIPFIIFNPETKQFDLTPEAVEFLHQVNGPIGLVAVAGMYRTGKSYLLNRMLLNRSNGFGVGPSINPCTKGMWVWGRPISGFTPEGEPINVLIVDTEGLGALDEDSNHDVRIFSLAILLSSYFLYNSVGSIDESALQNLSLVINLTKNIHIKARGNNEDLDTEEYSQYFPSFMWVVRDFTLMLVDADGEQISSKDYLEKALENQKGFSDNVEAKNRIRKLLKSFFKDRDCCTMIRPLTNEDDLQNLANMELDMLRADFVEQVMQLRRKVINKVKPKVLNGKKLNGQMLATLAGSYVTSINNGAVPNIETAWQYICKNECGKAVEEGLRRFEETLSEFVENRIPLDEEDLKQQYDEAKRDALSIFQKKAVGGAAEEYTIELKTKMKEIYFQLKERNQQESFNACRSFLSEAYFFIEKKLKNKEFQGGFSEYDQDMKAFQNYFIDNGPQGPMRREIMLDFVQKATVEAAEYFSKSVNNELELQRSIAAEQYKNLENQLKEMKGDHLKDKELLERKIRQVELERSELSAIEQSQKENIDKMRQEKSAMEKELMDRAEHDRKEMMREIEDYKNKLLQHENLIAESQRKVFATQSENEKEKALLDQKIEFLERTIQDYQKKEGEYTDELKNQKKDHQSLQRDLQQKYETQVRNLGMKLEETTEKMLELQSQLEEVEQKYNQEKQKWDENQESMKNNMTLSQSQYNEMNKTIEELKTKSKQEIERLQRDLQDNQDLGKQREEELEQGFKEKEDELKALRNRFDTELAVYKQKIEFKEVQNQQLKAQLEETRKTHEQMVNAMENKAKESIDGKEIAQKQVQELKESHTQELRELEKEFNEQRSRLENQVEQLGEKNNELELELTLLQSELEKETKSLKDQLEQSESQKQKALEQNRVLDSQKLKLVEETEVTYKSRIDQLEREIEDVTEKSRQEVREIQEQSESSLAQLKNIFEIDKQKFEVKLAEDKERAQKKLYNLQEEYELRLSTEQQNHLEDMEMVQMQLKESERKSEEQKVYLEHEISLLLQKIETLELYLAEKEERLAKEQSQTTSQMEAQLERFNNERKELFTKNESLNTSLNAKDREFTTIKNKYEALLEDGEKRKQQFEDMKSELVAEKTKLNDKIETLRQKNQEITDEYMQKKLEDGREIALYKQKLEFQQKKIDDLQKYSDDQIQRYEERITQIKQDFQQEIQETYLKANQSKEQQELKYEQKRRQFKEQEAQFQKQMTEIQKEKVVLQEKISNIESQREEIKMKYDSELGNLREQLNMAGEQVSKDREVYIHENERLKSTLQEMEKEYSEIQSSYERDKALWEGKFNFLEQQKDQAKQDLQEATKKFEMTLEQLHKRGTAEKDKIEHNQSTMLGGIEAKYKQQIKEQIENSQRTQNELSEKVKYLEKENRQLQNRLQLEQIDKMSDHGNMEKKVSELMDVEQRLSREIDELKSDRDKKLVEYQRSLEKERETYKQKLQEVEQKCKELENKRGTMMFEFEKERAKWGLDRDHIISQKQEIQEQVDKLQRRQETLLRENEKLKNERGARKQFAYGQGASGQGGIGSKYTPSMFGQTLMKNLAQKENTTSQMFAAGTFQKYIGGAGGDGNSEKSENVMKLGSPNATGAFLNHQRNESSGANSFKSLTNVQKDLPSDDTGSNY